MIVGGIPILIASELPKTYAIWNTADKSTKITIDGLKATKGTAPPDYAGVRANIGKSSGKWYWEMTVTLGSTASDAQFIGVSNTSESVDTFTGATVNGWSYSPGYKRHNGATLFGATFTTGDVIGVALDLDAGTLEFYKNGVSQGVAFSSGVSGTLYPAVSMGYNTFAVTANFGATAFAYSVPSGYNSGVYTQ